MYKSEIVCYIKIMKFEFSKTDEPKAIPRISLKAVYQLEADQTYNVTKKPPNTNKEMVALRTTGGCGIVEFANGEKITVLPYTLLLFYHNQVHSYYCADLKWDFWWFEFEISDNYLLHLMKVMDIKQKPNEDLQCSECLLMLRDKKSLILASTSFATLLYSWLFEYNNENEQRDLYYDKIQEIIGYLYLHINQNITVEEMADMIGLSTRRFRTLFENVTGKAPKEFIQEIKLNKAVELIKNTSMSIKQISIELGYSNPLYFSKVFKNTYGASPLYFKNDWDSDLFQ